MFQDSINKYFKNGDYPPILHVPLERRVLMISRILPFALAGATLLPVPTFAATSDPGRVGLEVKLLVPSGEAAQGMASRIGWAVGPTWTFPLRPTLDLRLGLDLAFLPRIQREYAVAGAEGVARARTRMAGGTAGVELLLRPWGRLRRPSLQAGLAYFAWRDYGGASGAVYPAGDHDPDFHRGPVPQASSGLQPSLGLGIPLTGRLDVMLRYGRSHLETNQGRERLDLLTLGAHVRF